MKDRITSGFVSGVIAAIPMNIIDWPINIFYGQKEYLYKWASIIIYGRLPRNTWEIAFSQAGQVFFAGILGIIFAYLILKLTSGNYLVKGWLYGVIAWFGIYGISIIARLPFLSTHSAVTVTSHLASASIYGLVLAEMIHWLSIKKLF